MYRQMTEIAEDNIDDSWGFPRKQRPQRIPAARVNVQQVNIGGDNLGVVNTGTVEKISNSLTVINGNDAALAGQLKALTEAIIASTALNPGQQQEAADRRPCREPGSSSHLSPSLPSGQPRPFDIAGG